MRWGVSSNNYILQPCQLRWSKYWLILIVSKWKYDIVNLESYFDTNLKILFKFVAGKFRDVLPFLIRFWNEIKSNYWRHQHQPFLMIKNVRLKNFWNPQIFTHALPRTERISFSKILELMNQLFLSFLIHISFPNRILLKTTKVVFLYKQFSLFCSLISFKVSFDVLLCLKRFSI